MPFRHLEFCFCFKASFRRQYLILFVVAFVLAIFAMLPSGLISSIVGKLNAPNSLPLSHPSTVPIHSGTDRKPGRPEILQTLVGLPLRFEPALNKTATQFFARGQGYEVLLSPAEATLIGRRRTSRDRYNKLAMKLIGGDKSAVGVGEELLASRTNYLIGNDPADWRRDVLNYARVTYREVYPGISVSYYGNAERLEYDYVVEPGGDPGRIRLAFEGAKRVWVEPNGDLAVTVKGGQFRHLKPVIYQPTEGAKVVINGRYVLRGKNEIGFELDSYDRSRPLVIDPVLVFSTYLGGTNDDSGLDVTTDNAGNIYVTGWTQSSAFPTVAPLDSRLAGFSDAFVTKMDAAGKMVIYSTYLGGSGSENGARIAVDGVGSVYVSGMTNASDFPLKNPFQAQRKGQDEAFVTKLSPTGNEILFSSYVGGSADDSASGIAITTSGDIYLTGTTRSTDFPVAQAIQSTLAGGADGFLVKVTSDGMLAAATYLGGSLDDAPQSVAVDRNGEAYIAGQTGSANFPVMNAYQPQLANRVGGIDGFITHFNAAGTALTYSTYLGGNSFDYLTDLAVDSSGNAYVTGYTGSDNFPLRDALQKSSGGQFDVFVTKLDRSGKALIFSTYLGGAGADQAFGIAVDSLRNVYITGLTRSLNFPVINSIQPNFLGDRDAFLCKINATGGKIVYSTYLGGARGETGWAVAVDSSGAATVTGVTTSPDFLVRNPLYNKVGTLEDAFVTKVYESASALPSFKIAHVVSNKGGNSGLVSVVIYGEEFVSGAKAKLVRNGNGEIAAITSKVSLEGKALYAAFDLTGKSTGQWDVMVVNPDGTTATLSNAFTIEPTRGAELWVRTLGFNQIRPSRAQQYTITYGNTGNVDAVAVPLRISGIPKDANVKLLTPLTHPKYLGRRAIDWSLISPVRTMANEKQVPLIIPKIPAGYSGSITLEIEVPGSLTFNLKAVLARPMFETKVNLALGRHALETASVELAVNSGDLECIKEITKIVALKAAEELLGKLLPIECADQVAKALIKIYEELADKYYGNEEIDDLNAVISEQEWQFSFFSLALECASDGLNLIPLARAAAFFMDSLAILMETVHTLRECGEAYRPVAEDTTSVQTVNSFDPNDKLGPKGFGTPRYFAHPSQMQYEIRFENFATATAPAQEVIITDQLDTSVLDVSTFGLGAVTFGGLQVRPPLGLTSYSWLVDLRPTTPLLVRVTAGLEKNTGIITWRFTSLDPTTGQPPLDPLAGFLPPNRKPPEGDGSVLFTISSHKAITSNTVVRNKARIIFDNNPPIDTPEWLNTIDITRPTSTVQPLAATQNLPTFEVKWTGNDLESGIGSYSIYVSENGGPFYLWLRDAITLGEPFVGSKGNSYAFYSVARDLAGNVEAIPDKPDTVTKVDNILAYEADIMPRPWGSADGKVTIADWVSIGRFVVGLDTPTSPYEFQRVDNAPKSTSGDGRITLADWVQAGRYASGMDTVVAAGGPTAPVTPPAIAEQTLEGAEAQTRTVRARDANFQRGQVGMIPIEFEAQGDENALAFTLNYDPAQMIFHNAVVGADAFGATININRTQAKDGRIGLAVALPAGKTFAAGSRSILTLRFLPGAGDKPVATQLTFSDQNTKRELVNAEAVPLATPSFVGATINISGKSFATVSAASYDGQVLATEQIVSSFGADLATGIKAATTLPLPDKLNGTTIKVKDSAGVERLAPIFYVSPTQVNFQLPPGMAEGIATITITNGDGVETKGIVQLGKVAPAIFSADSTGRGLAASAVVRVKSDGKISREDAGRYDPATGKIVAVPIDLGGADEQVFLEMYGTGVRYRSALSEVKAKVGGISVPVEFAGPQGGYVGLDQVNLKLPRALVGKGEVSIELVADDNPANVVRITIR